MNEGKTVEKVFQIFQAGKHTSMQGNTMEYSEADLYMTARTYRPNSAPLCLGHPADNKPVYGRVVSMFVKAGKLFAHADVGVGLLKAVKEGRYKNRSAAFYGMIHPDNPVPGAWTLRHVGFLGSVGPAVRGMDPLDFGEGQGCYCFASDCGTDVCSDDDIVQFSAPEGYQVAPAALRLLKLAQEYRRACPDISIIESAILAESVIDL